MIVPTTYVSAVALAILAFLCWGSWVNTFRLAGKWRFELYYYDFTFGVVFAALAAAFTFGSLGTELSFSDNFLIAGKLKMAAGFGAGLVINLAGFLLLAAVSVAGFSVALPLGMGIAIIVSAVWRALSGSSGGAEVWIGLVLVLLAVLVDAIAWLLDAPSRKPILMEEPLPAPRGVRVTARPKPVRPSGAKGIALSVAGGILLGAFSPLSSWAREGDNGLGPYSLILLMAGGIFVSTFIYNVYFLNLPVQGQALGMLQYFKGSVKQHLLGLLGGAIWCAGLTCILVEQNAPRQVRPGAILGFGMIQAAPLLAALWGLFAWQEFRGAAAALKGMLLAVFVLFAAGILMIGRAS